VYNELPYVFSLPIGSSPCLGFNELKKIADIVKDCDLIYFANAYAFHDIIIYFLKRRYQKPVISGQHATLFSDSIFSNTYLKTIRKTLLRRFDAIHVLNKNDEQILRKWGLHNIHWIPIGIDIEKFKPHNSEKDNAKFRVLFVGRLVSQKGVDILYHSIRIINNNEHLKREIEFWVVGSGPLQFLIKELAKSYENVKFFGRIEDEVLPEIYRECDLFVMPSRRETFGITALEAQASGLPVIVSNIPGPSDIVIDGITGSLVQNESPEAFVYAIKKYYDLWLSEHDKYKQICANARRNVLDHFAWEIVIPKIYNMFTSLIA
jgi:glycosyltransferase involved in cell wall biosynthesis